MSNTVPPLNLGRSFKPSDGRLTHHEKSGRLLKLTRRDKHRRRIGRRRGIREASSIEKALAKLRKENYEAQSLATNSHEAKRYVAMARRERLSLATDSSAK